MSLPRPAKIAILIVLAGGAAAGGYLALRDEGSASRQTTTDAYVTTDSTFVAPKIAGNISKVLVEDNQPVKMGDLLAVIDDRDFVVAVASAKADVKNAQADVQRLQASIIQQNSVIAQANAAIAADNASVTFAQANSSATQISQPMAPARSRSNSRLTRNYALRSQTMSNTVPHATREASNVRAACTGEAGGGCR